MIEDRDWTARAEEVPLDDLISDVVYESPNRDFVVRLEHIVDLVDSGRFVGEEMISLHRVEVNDPMISRAIHEAHLFKAMNKAAMSGLSEAICEIVIVREQWRSTFVGQYCRKFLICVLDKHSHLFPNPGK